MLITVTALCEMANPTLTPETALRSKQQASRNTYTALALTAASSRQHSGDGLFCDVRPDHSDIPACEFQDGRTTPPTGAQVVRDPAEDTGKHTEDVISI